MGRVPSAVVVVMLTGLPVAAQVPAARGELPAPRAEAAVKLVLGRRTGEAATTRTGLAHAPGGVIDVTQPRPDTVVITFTGLAACAGLPCEGSEAAVVFDVCQQFRIAADRNDTRPVRLVVDAQLVGILRGNRDGAGTASTDAAEAVVTAPGSPPLAGVAFPGRSHYGRDSLFINDKLEPTVTLLQPGDYVLTQKFAARCTHPPKPFHKNVMTAAFGPEPGKVPDWLLTLDPQREVPKNKPLGFQVTLRVEPATAP